MHSVTRSLIAGVAVWTIFGGQVFSQDHTFGLYGSLGYGFGIGGRYFESSTESGTGGPIDETDHYLNFGRGLKLDAGVAIQLMEHLEFTGGLVFSGGIPVIEAVDKTPSSTTTARHRRNQFGFKAQIAPSVTVFDLLDMYVGVGLGLFFNFSSEEIELETSGGIETAEIEYSNSPSLAFLSQIGALFPLNDQFLLFGELGLEAMSSSLREQRVTKSTFVFIPEETTEFERNSVTLQAPPKTPGTNLAIRFGVRYYIF